MDPVLRNACEWITGTSLAVRKTPNITENSILWEYFRTLPLWYDDDNTKLINFRP